MDLKSDGFSYHCFAESDAQDKKLLCQELSYIIAGRVRDGAISGVMKKGKLDELREEIMTDLKRAGHELYGWNVWPDCFEIFGYAYGSEENFGLSVEIDIHEGIEVSWKSPDGTRVSSERDKANEIKLINEDDVFEHGERRRREKLNWMEKLIAFFKIE